MLSALNFFCYFFLLFFSVCCVYYFLKVGYILAIICLYIILCGRDCNGPILFIQFSFLIHNFVKLFLVCIFPTIIYEEAEF